MFFRVVNARYKEKEYTYLKLLESHRYGDKVKHKQLINLSNINHLPADKIKPLFEDLSKTLIFFRELSESVPSSCKHLKTSYILALEKAFNVPPYSQNQDIRETILTDRKKKYHSPNDHLMFDYILKTHPEYGVSPEIYCWAEYIAGSNPQKNYLVCYLLDSHGFPLKYTLIDEQQDETVTTNTPGLMINNQQPAFFLAQACERIYIFLQLLGLKEKEYIFKEIYLVKQLADWSEKTVVVMEKVILHGPALMMRDEKISAALLSVITMKDHIAYVNSRINSVRGAFPLSDRDLVCTCFLSLFFRKMFETIKVRHSI